MKKQTFQLALRPPCPPVSKEVRGGNELRPPRCARSRSGEGRKGGRSDGNWGGRDKRLPGGGTQSFLGARVQGREHAGLRGSRGNFRCLALLQFPCECSVITGCCNHKIFSLCSLELCHSSLLPLTLPVTLPLTFLPLALELFYSFSSSSFFPPPTPSLAHYATLFQCLHPSSQPVFFLARACQRCLRSHQALYLLVNQPSVAGANSETPRRVGGRRVETRDEYLR